MAPNVITFAVGCGAAALIFIGFGLRALLLPPLMALATLVAIHLAAEPRDRLTHDAC